METIRYWKKRIGYNKKLSDGVRAAYTKPLEMEVYSEGEDLLPVDHENSFLNGALSEAVVVPAKEEKVDYLKAAVPESKRQQFYSMNKEVKNNAFVFPDSINKSDGIKGENSFIIVSFVDENGKTRNIKYTEEQFQNFRSKGQKITQKKLGFDNENSIYGPQEASINAKPHFSSLVDYIINLTNRFMKYLDKSQKSKAMSEVFLPFPNFLFSYKFQLLIVSCAFLLFLIGRFFSGVTVFAYALTLLLLRDLRGTK